MTIPTPEERKAMREWIADQRAFDEPMPVVLDLAMTKWGRCLDGLDEAEKRIAELQAACAVLEAELKDVGDALRQEYSRP